MRAGGCPVYGHGSAFRGIVRAGGCPVYCYGSAVRGIVRAGGCPVYGHGSAFRGIVRAGGCPVYCCGSAVRGIVRAGGCLVYGHGSAVRAMATQAKDLGFDFCWHFQCPPFSPHTIHVLHTSFFAAMILAIFSVLHQYPPSSSLPCLPTLSNSSLSSLVTSDLYLATPPTAFLSSAHHCS